MPHYPSLCSTHVERIHARAPTHFGCTASLVTLFTLGTGCKAFSPGVYIAHCNWH